MTLESGLFATAAPIRHRMPPYNHARIFFVLFAIWWLLLSTFYLLPQIDLWVANSFFLPFVCGDIRNAVGICGTFPYSKQEIFQSLRKVLFYVPSFFAFLVLLKLVIEVRRRPFAFSATDVRLYVTSLVAFVLGPYLIVNLWLKTHSDRPRPYETDIFGGNHAFAPAGSFSGTCDNNCSFISGESAGAGWLVCLIFLIPPPLRTALAPPLLAISFVTPALRVAFGGHYLSDAVLGWLSSPVVFFGLLALAEVTHRRKNFAN